MSSGSMFKKNADTYGIRGQLYETKLLSLLYFRAIHDENIEEFHLATNIDKIGAFDDICFKAKVQNKPIAVFVQVKHRENEKHILKNNLATYVDSYKKIKQRFDPSNEDLFFRGAFDETECMFVIYTTVRADFGNKSAEGGLYSTLYDLLDTGGTAKHSNNQEEDVVFLCNEVIKDQITSLAKKISKFLVDGRHFQIMLSDELVLRYHVILARKVLDVSDIQPVERQDVPRHRIASFRQDFFDNTEEYIMLFRETLYLEVIKQRKLEPAEIRLFLSEFLGDPTDAARLSKLIGTAVKYINGQLEFDKETTKVFRPNMKPINISRATVNKAVELAAIEILSPVKFKVPAAFGNKDLPISGSDAKIERKIYHLACKIKELLDKCAENKIVTIDESLEADFLQLNGFIASAIGNIFVLDDNTKLMKVTNNCESLGILAQKLYEKLNDEIHNLLEYKFLVNNEKFPKISFDSNEYENNLAKDFLDKLLFYSGQADEGLVEEILKNEIQEYQCNHQNYFQVKSDAIFLRYHDEILKWWMSPGQALYLTRESDTFNKAISNIIEDPLMNSIKVTYMSKIHHFEYSFREDVASSWSLQDHSSTVIITENSVLTVVKVLQHLKNKEHVTVLDLEYILKLPTNDRTTLRTELTNTRDDNYLIFVCDKILNFRKEKKILEDVAKVVHKKNTIIVTNNAALTQVNEYFPEVDNRVHDNNISLIHMSDESQKIILSNARLIFQGKEVRLESIVDDKAKAFVKGDILNAITSEKTIVVGKLTVNETYDEIKHLYVDRRIKKHGDDRSKEVKILDNISDKVVLITAEPGMGKSTLLTHLSLKTKELKPEVWIVRINLLEYSKEFSKMKEEKAVIDTLETVKFMCQVILREKHGCNDNYVEFELKEDNGVVYLVHCAGDQWTEFELRLFLHLYNKGRMIFLFDGFDEICPHYEKQVIACIKNVSYHPRKHRKWITSRSYNEVATILHKEFGSSYEIDNLTYEEMETYLETFWDFHLKLEELDTVQLENVKSFIEYTLASHNLGLHKFAMPLHQVYINAAYHFINEIKYKAIPSWTYDTNYDDSYIYRVKQDNFILKYHETNSDGNPLHLYLAAVFLEENIKTVDNKINKWNLEINAFSFYERFMEKKMRTIRFQEKNKLNICIPDIMMTYDKELADFILKHKKLAAYAIFKLDHQLLFSVRDVNEIQEMIKFIEKGGEKTGLIYRVVNGIPIFIHMTFTEYFAVEYVCDCLKTEKDSERLITWMNFIFNTMFSMDHLAYIRNIFDYRITVDEELMRILENNKEIIFNLIMQQGEVYSAVVCNMKSSPNNNVGNYWALSDALLQELHNFQIFFVSILEYYLNDSNLNGFLDIVRDCRLLQVARNKSRSGMIKCVINIVRKIDERKLASVLRDNFTFLSDHMISLYAELSTEDITELLLAKEIDEENLTAFESTCSLEPHSSQALPMIYGLSKRIHGSSSSVYNLSNHPSTLSLPAAGSSTSHLCRQLSSVSLYSGAVSYNLPRSVSTSDLVTYRSGLAFDRSIRPSSSVPALSVSVDREHTSNLSALLFPSCRLNIFIV